MNPDHRFGVEIEFNVRHVSAYRVADYLRQQGLRATDADRLHNQSGFWCVKPDGSVTGWEIVSPILTPANYADQIDAVGRAFEAMRTDGHRIGAGRDCGLHVHLSGCGETDTDKLRAICRRVMNHERVLDLIHPVHRRTNTYCMSNLARYAPYNPATFRPDMERAYENMWERTAACRTTDELYESVCNDRYFRLNLESLSRHGTIEFRQHAGTVTPFRIRRWVEFLSAFVDVAANQTRLWRRSTRPQTQGDRVRKMLRGVPAPTARYLRTRIREVNGEHIMQQAA